MTVFVQLFGVAVIVMGIMFSANLDRLKGYVSYWKDKKHMRVGALVAIAAGVVFLIAAPDCKLSLLITILGIWSVVKGVALLILQQEKIVKYLDWWLNRPVSTMRIMAGVVVAFGVLLLYSV
jgi:uncharacterized membrane protein HdeD (DUF308 family)